MLSVIMLLSSIWIRENEIFFVFLDMQVGSTKLTASWVHSYIGMTILPATQGFPRGLSHSGSCGREKIFPGDGDENLPQLIWEQGLCFLPRRVLILRIYNFTYIPS